MPTFQFRVIFNWILELLDNGKHSTKFQSNAGPFCFYQGKCYPVYRANCHIMISGLKSINKCNLTGLPGVKSEIAIVSPSFNLLELSGSDTQ